MKYYKYINIKKTYQLFSRNLYSFAKFFYPRYYNLSQIYFLRKNKTFIKSKYSRTRQWSKVIVYFGLWYGILSVFFLMYYCYRFIFIFSYFWWFIFGVVFFAFFKNSFKNFKFFYLRNLFK